MNTLFSHVTVLCMDEANTVLRDAYVLVRGREIAYVGPVRPQETVGREINGTGKVLMPGFVDTHTHLTMSLMRGYAGGHDLQTWLNDYIFPVEAKLDSRAAVFRDGRILLVQENDGRWAMPGGWVEVGLSVMENTIKEAREEAGAHVLPRRVVAVHEAERHCHKTYAYKVCKVFMLCSLLEQHFEENIETLRCDWFTQNDLPPLAEEKTNADQIALCFEAHQAEHWETRFD